VPLDLVLCVFEVRITQAILPWCVGFDDHQVVFFGCHRPLFYMGALACFLDDGLYVEYLVFEARQPACIALPSIVYRRDF
jgi:hypothetical protein